MSDVHWISSQSTPKASLYTSLPYGASYLRTNPHIPSSPVQCIWELPASQPMPSGNLTILPLQPHISERTNPEKFVSHPSLMCLHLYSYHFTWDQQPHSIARHPICHFIKMDCTQSQDAATAATGDLNHNTKLVLLIQKKNFSDFGFNFPQMTISKLASLILQIKTTI